MDLEKAMLHGDERENALRKIGEQLSTWGITMPRVEPYALHFGLHDFYTTGETEFWIANEMEAGYCGKFLFVFDGQTCPYHNHKIKHETFFVLKGSVRMKVNGVDRAMVEGDVLVMPPGDTHSFTGIGPCLILEVSMPSTVEDNYFEDKAIGY